MITGEYAVLFGAKSFSVPTFLGQRLDVIVKNQSENNLVVDWKSYEKNGNLWVDEHFADVKSTSKNESEITVKVKKLLNKVFELSTQFAYYEN